MLYLVNRRKMIPSNQLKFTWRRTRLKAFLTIPTLLATCLLYAQDVDDMIPYRPKIAEFSSETIMDYRTQTSSEQFGGSDNEIERDRTYKAKLGIPLLITPDRMFGVQLKYYRQNFLLDLKEHPTDYDLFIHLNTKTFTSAGVRTLYKQTFEGGNELKLVAGAEFKSDQWEWNRNSTKYFFSGIQTWQKSASTEIGGGLMVNWNMRLFSVYPLFLLTHDLNHKWTVDLMLPKCASMRYRINSRNYFIFRTQMVGWRYNLNNALKENDGDLTLRKTDLQFSVSYEREIHDWLWLGLDLGYNKNLQYFLANPGDRSRLALIDVHSRDALYTRFSIFMVPPGKFYR